MSNDIHCPLCNSVDINTQIRLKNISEPFSGSDEVELVENICNTCGMAGDFLDINDKAIEEKYELLKEKSAISILNDFSKHGLNYASMERALDLPQRTLAKWKSTGKPSAAGLTLLRFLRLFPWLIEVAEHRYEFQNSQKICAKAALGAIRFTDPMGITEDSIPATNNLFYFPTQVNITNQNAVFKIEPNTTRESLVGSRK
ncbi:MAG: hypothetical protein KJ630_24940 [Proteobacteria bacterium]|nr:hypothetical protein [Pseudomonadota bacterium]